MAILRRLLELLLKDGQLVFQIGDLGAELSDFVLETGEALAVERIAGRFDTDRRIQRNGLRLRGRFLDVSGEEMDKARFLVARLARDNLDEWWIALHEEIEGRVHGPKIVELIEAVGTSAKLAVSLRAAQKQDA